MMDISSNKYSEIVKALSVLIEVAHDRHFDLRGLSEYSSLAVPTIRDYLKGSTPIPHFKLRGKILVKKSEFDTWLETKFRVRNDLDGIVDDVLKSL